MEASNFIVTSSRCLAPNLSRRLLASIPQYRVLVTLGVGVDVYFMEHFPFANKSLLAFVAMITSLVIPNAISANRIL